MSEQLEYWEVLEAVSPVVKMVVRNGTVEVKRECKLKSEIHKGKRGKIYKLSQKSLARLAFLVTETQVQFTSLLTVTFGDTFPKNGKTVKSLVNSFRQFLMRTLGCSYLWFMEFQTRGAPHIHFLLSSLPTNRMRKTVFECWVRLVSSRLSLSEDEAQKLRRQHRRRKNWEKLRSVDGAKRYALKYALKPYQKDVPEDFQDVGRFWSASRDVARSIPDGVEVDITGSELRDWLALQGNEVANFPVLPKYIYKRLTND